MYNIKYIIVSCPGYSLAREMLIDSLLFNKICIDNIFIIHNKSRCPIVDSKSKPVSVYLEENLFEYGFFIGVNELLDQKIVSKKDIFFLLHDTCLAGHYFRINTEKAAKKYIIEQDYNIVHCNNWGQHNIGLYDYTSVMEGFSEWKKYDCITKDFAVGIEHDGYNRLSPKSWKLKQYFPLYGSNLYGIRDVYGDGFLREVNYLSIFDLRKYFFWFGGFHPNKAGE